MGRWLQINETECWIETWSEVLSELNACGFFVLFCCSAKVKSSHSEVEWFRSSPKFNDETTTMKCLIHLRRRTFRRRWACNHSTIWMIFLLFAVVQRNSDNCPLICRIFNLLEANLWLLFWAHWFCFSRAKRANLR